MKPLKRRGSLSLMNRNLGRKSKIKIVVESMSFKTHKTMRKREGEFGGFYPIKFPGNRKEIPIQYVNVLQGAFLEWIRDCVGLRNIIPWPVTVTGTFDGKPRVYTPVYLVDIDPLPVDLKRMGFGPRTFIECKPDIYQDNWDVQLTMEMLRLATGMPVFLVTSETIMMSILNEQQEPFTH